MAGNSDSSPPFPRVGAPYFSPRGGADGRRGREAAAGVLTRSGASCSEPSGGGGNTISERRASGRLPGQQEARLNQESPLSLIPSLPPEIPPAFSGQGQTWRASEPPQDTPSPESSEKPRLSSASQIKLGHEHLPPCAKLSLKCLNHKKPQPSTNP